MTTLAYKDLIYFLCEDSRAVKSVGGELSGCFSILVLVEDDIALIFNEAALGESSIESPESVRRIAVVLFAQQFLELFSNVGLVVPSDVREEMVSNMVVANVVEVNTSGPAKERPVNRRKSAPKVRPLAVSVHGNCRVRVMEIGKHDDPVVQENVRNEVELDERRNTDGLRPPVENATHNSQPNVGGNDPVTLMRFEQRRRRIEVVGAFRVSRGSHGVQAQVDLPSEKLHKKHTGNCVNGSLFEELMVVGSVGRGFCGQLEVGSGTRNVVLVSFDRDSGLVMRVMSGSPRKVRCKNKSVEQESNRVVDPFFGRDISMTSLVSHAPPTSENNTLSDPIGSPATPFSDRANIRRETISVNQAISQRLDLPS